MVHHNIALWTVASSFGGEREILGRRSGSTHQSQIFHLDLNHAENQRMEAATGQRLSRKDRTYLHLECTNGGKEPCPLVACSSSVLYPHILVSETVHHVASQNSPKMQSLARLLQIPLHISLLFYRMVGPPKDEPDAVVSTAG